MKYFTCMICLVCLAVVALLIQSVHKFAGMFEELGTELPKLSQWILQSHGAFPMALVVVLAIAAMVAAFLLNSQKLLWLTIATVFTMLLCAGLVVIMLYIPLTDAISQMQ